MGGNDREGVFMRYLLIIGVALFSLAAGTNSAVAADAEAGVKVFKKCKACHSMEVGKNKVGPSLAGIVGRPAGQVEGFKYSAVMAESEVVWDEANLDAFLAKPKDFMKGTKMSFPGLKKEEDRANVIAFFMVLSTAE
jgi:cytochrome c